MNLSRVQVIRWVAGGLLVVLVGAAVTGRLSGGEEAAPAGRTAQPIAVQTEKVAAAPIQATLTYSATIHAKQQVGVAPRTAGQVTQILVAVGATVRAGDTLATLDAGTLPAQVQQARANVDAAEARLRVVLDGAKVSDISAARAQFDAAQARLAQLLNPSASDRAAAESAAVAAQTAVDNATAAANGARALLLSAVTIYCNTWPNFGLPCNGIQLPLTDEVESNMQSALTTRAGDPMSEGGVRSIAVLDFNARYKIALAAVPSARQALIAATARRDAVLNPSAADISAQRSMVEQARAGLERTERPYTDADVQSARAVVSQAQAGLAIAQSALDQTAVRAPFDGVVAQQILEVGASASPASPAFLLTARAVEARLTVEEARIGQLSPGLDAEMTLAAFPGRTFPAKVSSVAPTGDTRGHTFEVKVVAQDADGLLRQGMFAQVSIVTAQKASTAAVPRQAIVERQGKPVVFVLQDGKASQRAVQSGITNTMMTEVVSGLTAGDEIIVVGQNIVRDGQEVRVIPRS